MTCVMRYARSKTSNLSSPTAHSLYNSIVLPLASIKFASRRFNRQIIQLSYPLSSGNSISITTYFAELTCKVDAIYYATSTAVEGVFSDGNSTVTIFSKSGVKLNYDYSSERLIYYDGSDLISVKLDGTDELIIASVRSLFTFAIDHIERKAYYITTLFKDVHSIDLESGNATNLGLSFGGGVQDLDTDPSNR